MLSSNRSDNGSYVINLKCPAKPRSRLKYVLDSLLYASFNMKQTGLECQTAMWPPLVPLTIVE